MYIFNQRGKPELLMISDASLDTYKCKLII